MTISPDGLSDAHLMVRGALAALSQKRAFPADLDLARTLLETADEILKRELPAPKKRPA